MSDDMEEAERKLRRVGASCEPSMEGILAAARSVIREALTPITSHPSEAER